MVDLMTAAQAQAYLDAAVTDATAGLTGAAASLVDSHKVAFAPYARGLFGPDGVTSGFPVDDVITWFGHSAEAGYAQVGTTLWIGNFYDSSSGAPSVQSSYLVGFNLETGEVAGRVPLPDWFGAAPLGSWQSAMWAHGTKLYLLLGVNSAMELPDPLPACLVGVDEGARLAEFQNFGGGVLLAYDTATHIWTRCADKPNSSLYTNAAPVIGSTAYVIGYYRGGVNTGGLDAYDCDTDTWTTLSQVPDGDAWSAQGFQVFVSAGKIYALVSANSGLGRMLSYMYDPETDIWSPIAAAPSGLVYGGAYSFNNGSYPPVLVPISDTEAALIPSYYSAYQADTGGYVQADVWIYNTVGDEWKFAGANFPVELYFAYTQYYGCPIGKLENGNVVAFGDSYAIEVIVTSRF